MHNSSDAEIALLRSQSGAHASEWLTAMPTEPGMTLSPLRMAVSLRRRLRLPLPLRPRVCGRGCRHEVDQYGDHCATCRHGGLIQRRAKPVERMWVRVCREAVGCEGQVIPQQWLAHTTAPNVRPDDRRRLDLVVYGASSLGQVYCCDATVVSPLHGNGLPHNGATYDNGACLKQAARRKRSRYPELLGRGPAKLVVLGVEVGGRWCEESLSFMDALVMARAKRAPPVLRTAAVHAWRRRWWCLLSIAVQDAVAATLVQDKVTALNTALGFDEPFLADVLDPTLAGETSTMGDARC